MQNLTSILVQASLATKTGPPIAVENIETSSLLSACVHEMFESQVERTPDAVAVVFDDEQLTYRQLNNQANQLARELLRLGVDTDSLVGACIDRSPQMVVGLLAILKAGGAYVPLDPSYPHDRLAFMLADANAPVLLTQSSMIEKLPRSNEYKGHILSLDRDWHLIAHNSTENPGTSVGAENLAYVIYTSGSTGNPRAR